MDELPRHAKELLKLASDLDECRDDEARRRVREGVAKAVGVHEARVTRGLTRAEMHVATTKPLGGLAAKLAATTALFALVGAGLTFWPSATPTSRGAAQRPDPIKVVSSYVVARPVVSSGSTIEARDPPAMTEVDRAEPVAAVRHNKRAARDTLNLEVELLRQVGDALSGGETRRARRLLDQHRTRFARPLLLEERAGLHALLRCLEHAADAATEARVFVESYPHSVLGLRVRRACEPGDEP